MGPTAAVNRLRWKRAPHKLFFTPSPTLAVFLLSVFYCTGTFSLGYAGSQFTVWHRVIACPVVVTLVSPVVVKSLFTIINIRAYIFLYERQHFSPLCPFSVTPGMYQRVYIFACVVWFWVSRQSSAGARLVSFLVCNNMFSAYNGLRLRFKRLTSFLLLALRDIVGEWKVSVESRISDLSWIE